MVVHFFNWLYRENFIFFLGLLSLWSQFLLHVFYITIILPETWTSNKEYRPEENNCISWIDCVRHNFTTFLRLLNVWSQFLLHIFYSTFVLPETWGTSNTNHTDLKKVMSFCEKTVTFWKFKSHACACSHPINNRRRFLWFLPQDSLLMGFQYLV